MFEPDNGQPINPKKKTEVKILYTDEAIYVGALLFDDEPSKIMKEITERDDFGATDVFGIFINGYNDGQQDFRFFVTAAGGQLDCLATEQIGEDFSWNAIWESKVKITSFGWAVEMKIPYAALRFSSESEQESVEKIEGLMKMTIPLIDFPEEVEISTELIEKERPQIKEHYNPIKRT